MYKKSKNLKKQFNTEKKFIDFKSLQKFSNRVLSSKIKLLKILNKLKLKKKSIAGISAPSRASTLINYVGINQDLINCIFEIKNSHKIGYYAPGTNIPILEEKASSLKKYDFLILFSWHIADDLIKNIKKKGFKGKFIIPLPEPKII